MILNKQNSNVASRRAKLALLSGGLLLSSLTQGATAIEPTVYGNVVAPILHAKCVGCHGSDKQKGKFAMQTIELLMKGGKSEEKSIVPNHSDQSEVFRRISLPGDDDDHMPPEDKDQLTKEEIAILKWWIDSGASADAKLVEGDVPGDIKVHVVKIAKANPDGVVVKAAKDPGPVVPPPTPEQEAAIAKIQEDLNVVILPVSQDNPGLTFTAVNVAKEFDDAMLARFDPIAGNLLQVNLARTNVTDGGLGSISKMGNLTRLRLEKTGVTDGGLDHLAKLENLEYLNLYGTKITDAGLAKLSGLKKLSRLYVWQTEVSEEGAKKLTAELPEVLINLGWDKEVGKKPEIIRVAAIEIPKPAAPDPETVYGGLIHPVFEAKCVGCHGADKQKGKLALNTLEALLKGGKSEKTVVAGKSGESELARRTGLPADDDDHMPPKDKDQLSAIEIALLKWWIDAGAKGDTKIADTQVPASIFLLK